MYTPLYLRYFSPYPRSYAPRPPHVPLVPVFPLSVPRVTQGGTEMA